MMLQVPTARQYAFAERRILVIGKSLSADSMEAHVVDAFAGMGCKVWSISNDGRPLDKYPSSRWCARINEFVLREPERRNERSLVRAVSVIEPELTLVLQGNYLSPKSVAALRHVTNKPIVCWCQDQISAYGRQYILGADYDAVFVKDRYLQQLFAQTIRSTQFHYLAEACNPVVHRTVSLSESDHRRHDCDVLMLGSLYYYRQEILRQLSDYDLRIRGARPSWLLDRVARFHKGGDLVLEEKAKAVSAARVALNTLHCAEIDALNCRTFELAGCGGFQIMSHRSVLMEHFIPGVEIESFVTIEELREKIHHYLANPDMAQAIARRGQQRAHNEHTYQHRLAAILQMFLGEPRRV